MGIGHVVALVFILIRAWEKSDSNTLSDYPCPGLTLLSLQKTLLKEPQLGLDTDFLSAVGDLSYPHGLQGIGADQMSQMVG